MNWGFRRRHIKSISLRLLITITICIVLSVFGLRLYYSVVETKSHRALERLLNITEVHNGDLEFSFEEMGPTNVFKVVRPNKSTILLEPDNSHVKNGEHSNKLFALALVLSTARSFNQRRGIRNSWYKLAPSLNTRVLFFIGYHGSRKHEIFQALAEEQKQHNDLIIDNYQEGYYRLTGKVLRMLKWYNSTYSEKTQPRFLIKTDHDVFLNLPKVVEGLQETKYYNNLALMSESHNNLAKLSNSNISNSQISDDLNLELDPNNSDTYFIGGDRIKNARVAADEDSKWYLYPEERKQLGWRSIRYPTYLNGPCYILSGNVVKEIYQKSFTVPIFPFEDVYLIGMVASYNLKLQISSIRRMHLRGRFWRYVKNARHSNFMAMHPVMSPASMEALCRTIQTCNVTMSGGGKVVINFLTILSAIFAIILNYFI